MFGAVSWMSPVPVLAAPVRVKLPPVLLMVSAPLFVLTPSSIRAVLLPRLTDAAALPVWNLPKVFPPSFNVTAPLVVTFSPAAPAAALTIAPASCPTPLPVSSTP